MSSKSKNAACERVIALLAMCSHSNEAYQVRSANFSRRMIRHVHDNSVDSENVAGAREPSVHTHFIFRFENGQGNKSFFFYPWPKYSWNESTTSSANGRLTCHREGVSARPPAGPEKSLVQHGLVEKKKGKLHGQLKASVKRLQI